LWIPPTSTPSATSPSWGIVDGVTTNPSLIMKSGRDIKEVTKEICDLGPGPVSAETVALDAEGMIAEGKELAKIATTSRSRCR
jgi:transaldolase